MAGRTDDELLGLVADERRRSIGFDHDQELAADRLLALNYYKGEMPDQKTAANRSKAVSTDVADAVETVLPDLIEIFTGGDDVATFQPIGPEDEEGAQQETDYVNHVVFDENAGFLVFYSMFKDALLQKVGVVKSWWEDEEPESEAFEGKSSEELAVALQSNPDGISDYSPNEDGTYNFTVQGKQTGRVKIMAVPPEDFAVSADTVELQKATYSAMRSRPRAQDLIEDGYKRADVDRLPPYGTPDDQVLDRARDTAGEHERGDTLGGLGDLRTVEIVEHYIRLADETGCKIWKIVTGGDETILLEKEEVERVPFAAVTPYLTPHRFYGRSVADVLLEIQRIKTALTRMALDSGYFALNQRHYVDMSQANEFTISDLLDNRPGLPVRGKGAAAVTPLSGPGLSFDAFGALEYFSVAGEQRSGIVRNAQGLNPDTLHDTAKGAMALMGAAQKRVRLIAKVFAETGLKDLFLGVHALIRQNATAQAKVRLRSKWVDVDPTSWGERNDMRIELGLGAGGREHDLMMLQMQMGVAQNLVALQGGQASGPLFTMSNAYNLAKRFFEKTGAKAPEQFISDPDDPNTPRPQAQPQEDPASVKAKADAMVRAQKDQLDAKANEAAAARKHELDQLALQAKERVDTTRVEGELELKRYQVDQELILKRDELAAEAELEQQKMAMQHDLAETQAEHGMAMAEDQQAHSQEIDEAKLSSDVKPGGDPG